MRWLIWAMVLIGAFGIMRAIFSASEDREEWMRWAPSVDLTKLEDGAQAEIVWNGRLWVVRALTPEQVEAVSSIPPDELSDPEPIADRLLRVEVLDRTRWFAVVAPRGRHCILAVTDDGWRDNCYFGRWDLAGRIYRRQGLDNANLAIPNFVVRNNTLHLRPDQPASRPSIRQ